MYKETMKRMNFALSSDDYGMVLALRKLLNIETDSEIMRKALNELYMSVCQDRSFVEFFDNLLVDIDNLREKLLMLKVDIKCH